MSEAEALQEVEDKGASILCVDDERNILSALKRTLRSENYEIHIAEGGQEGLKVMEEHEIDLVISDMRMPEMSGAEFLEKVAAKWPSTVRILLTGYSDISSTIDAVNKGKIFQYISKPWDDNEIKLSVERALEKKFLEKERQRLIALTNKQNEELKEFNKNLEFQVKQRTEEIQQTMDMLDAAHQSLKDGYVASIGVLSHVIEMRECTQGVHLRNVPDYAQKMGLRMGMDEVEAQQLLFAAQLRNAGKIVLSDELVGKPFSLLSKEDREAVIKSAVVSEAVIMTLTPLQEASTIIRHQHERFDGKGFPDKLKGEKIPLGARILAVVNDYEALNAGYLSANHMGSKAAKEFLTMNCSKRYDTDVVKEFFKLLAEEDANAQEENVSLVPSGSLKAGMVLARDLVNSSGVLMLSKGYVLDEAIIDKVQRFEMTIDEDLIIYVCAEA